MAYTPITNTDIEVNKTISSSLFTKVKDNFSELKAVTDIHTSQIQDISAQHPWINVTYNNGWTSFDAFWAPLSYYKDPTGRVHLRGMAKGALHVVIGNLPIGYRPANIELFVTNSSHQLGRIDIDGGGNIVAKQGDSNQWISFSGISFRAI
ncbi:MAG: hypothetical protein PHY47_00525 [Lachnospiraceae bacterium]|nr:hypothetical protein [Lachnospiraceae bacterium]